MAWQTFSVQLKGESEPHIIETSARDWRSVQMDPAQGVAAMDMTFQVVHNALQRHGIAVPRDYESFLDVLDGLPEAIDGGDPNMLDPTSAAASGGSP